MSKIHFVTFGCDERFKVSRKKITEEARKTGWFDKIFLYDPSVLYNHSNYKKNFQGRGAGYWWWKPVVQSMALNQIDDDDLLLYLDAGFFINPNGHDEFKRYINLVNSSVGLLAHKLSTVNKEWTKRDLFKLLDCDTIEYANDTQIAAGFVLYKKNKIISEFLENYVKVGLIDHAMNDDPSYNKNYEGYIEHRHDQSVFSLLIKKTFRENEIASVVYGQDYADDVSYIRDHYWPNTNNPVYSLNRNECKNLKHPFYAARISDVELGILI